MATDKNGVDITNYKSFFEALPGFLILLAADKPQFTIVAITEDLLELTGRKREDIYNKPLFEVFPANPAIENFTGEQDVRSSFEYVISRKQEHQFTSTRYDITDGEGRYVEKYWQAKNRPVLNDQGEVNFIIHNVVDITDIVKFGMAEKRLKLAEQSYLLFMQAPVAICILKGENHQIELANDDMLKIWRKEPGIIGKPLLEALPEVKGTVFPHLLDSVLFTNTPYHANESSLYFSRNGVEEQAFFNFVYQPYNERGSLEPVGVLVVANEVTEQVFARKKIEESEQRYRDLISEAAVATAVYVGQEMRIAYANDAMIKLWGKDVTAIGKTVREALPELDGQPFHSLLEHVFATGETYWGKEDKAELEVNGQLETFYFNFTYKALKNSDGENYGILNMAVDVTEQVAVNKALQESEANLQKKVEERTIELQNKNKELEYSNEELKQFAYIASHDLQEPLRKIRTFSDMLAKKMEPANELRKFVDKINASAARMSGLINSLLDYSRLSKRGVRFEKVDLNAILQNVLLDYELLISQKEATISISDLPTIYAVPLQMNQLFYNLLGNALKFTKRNVRPLISITNSIIGEEQKREWGLDPQKEYIKIVVQDNGIGFNQNYANKIFTIFQRLNNNSQYGGYGIGLTLCKKVIDAHNGRIVAHGKLEEGAIFTIILPVNK